MALVLRVKCSELLARSSHPPPPPPAAGGQEEQHYHGLEGEGGME